MRMCLDYMLIFSTLGWKWKENYKISYASLFLITSKFRYFTCANSFAGKSIREVRKVRKDQAYERVNKMEIKKAEIQLSCTDHLN